MAGPLRRDKPVLIPMYAEISRYKIAAVPQRVRTPRGSGPRAKRPVPRRAGAAEQQLLQLTDGVLPRPVQGHEVGFLLRAERGCLPTATLRAVFGPCSVASGRAANPARRAPVAGATRIVRNC
jgi:hypothetical protein